MKTSFKSSIINMHSVQCRLYPLALYQSINRATHSNQFNHMIISVKRYSCKHIIMRTSNYHVQIQHYISVNYQHQNMQSKLSISNLPNSEKLKHRIHLSHLYKTWQNKVYQVLSICLWK